MTRGPRSESSTYADIVIVGAGHAGAQLVFSLAQNNYAGSVMLIGDEPHQPYERPPLSKAYLKGDLDRAGLALREPAYWGAASAVLRLGQPVVAVDPQTRSATLGNGEIVGYGDLVWAAGGRARRLPLPGADLDGVVYLRDLADADDLVERLSPDRKVCIIGGGYGPDGAGRPVRR
ncbi:MAG: FAD-dependent oxidoreductase [Candidatus Brevundimonas colombiensis]|uniref:FAD-dependent oxidoreductase n=1 Tax=Candidatus Brevundimonas colombiensis TaxID=3121376 RepID=A0AAJ5X6S7_9CAUL|nr:FAD-dependent oxidoreductase [Brevundimonas sp.]WEK41475.1 MAG: FAD-dependent oxidoreductase [Brevundimonas sp.]